VPHRFTFASVWELPVGRGKRFAGDISRAADLIVGGWQLNTDISIQSGPPFSVFSNGQRVDLLGDPTPTEAQRAQGILLNKAAFRAPVTSVFPGDPRNATLGDPKFGSLGRNVLRGDRQEFVNASLFKNLHITEGFTVQLRAQAYNLFNHVNGFRPNNDFNSADFGKDLSEQRRRQLEFGLRMIF
jgi:hypothetical protein